MKVLFEASVDDFAEVALRSVQRSPSMEASRRRSWALLTIALAVLVFLVAPFASLTKALMAVLAAALTAFLFPLVYRHTLKMRFRQVWREQFTGADSTRIEVEIDEGGLTFRQRGTEITYRWSTVERVETAEDRVDFLLAGDGVATVRDRAFHSLEHRQQFVQLARALQAGETESS